MPFGRLLFYVIIILLVASGPVQGADPGKEAYLAEELRQQLRVGELIWLQASEENFPAIYSKSNRNKPLGGIILLHDLNAHPDWPEVISPLRKQLITSGWNTLSLQMPLQPDTSTTSSEYLPPLFNEAMGRIQGAITYLTGQGIQNIILVGHGLGADQGAAYLANDQTSPQNIAGFIALAPKNPHGLDQSLQFQSALANIKIPVLEIIKKDPNGNTLQSHNTRTHQRVEILGASNNLNGHEAFIIKRIKGWLKKNLANRSARPQADETKKSTAKVN
jgi:hypothetical protein